MQKKIYLQILITYRNSRELRGVDSSVNVVSYFLICVGETL